MKSVWQALRSGYWRMKANEYVKESGDWEASCGHRTGIREGVGGGRIVLFVVCGRTAFSNEPNQHGEIEKHDNGANAGQPAHLQRNCATFHEQRQRRAGREQAVVRFSSLHSSKMHSGLWMESHKWMESGWRVDHSSRRLSLCWRLGRAAVSLEDY